MELRSCSHLHFIQAIKGGLVIKVRNVDSCGKPALVFKKLKDIYETEDVKNLNTLSTLKQQNRCSNLVFNSGRVKTESPCFPMAERKTKKRAHESDEFNCNISVDEKDSDSDDVSFGKMTLKQLKEMCMTKKRKFSKLVGLTPTQDHSSLQVEEDEFDLKEPLSCWKSKLSKNSKVKRKYAKKGVFTSSEISVSVKSEFIASAEESLQLSGDLPTPIKIKVEVPGPECSECQNMICIADDSSIGFSEEIGVFGAVSSEIIETVKCELETQEPISLTEECQSCVSCVVNEVSYDHLEQDGPISFLPPIGREAMEVVNLEKTFQQSSVSVKSEYIANAEESLQSSGDLPTPINIKGEVPGPECLEGQNMICVADDSSIGFNEQVGVFGSVSSEIIETVKCDLETQEPTSLTEECQSCVPCVVNEVSYDHLEQVEPISFLPPIGRVAMEVVNLEKTYQQSSVSPVSEFKKEGYVKHPLSHESSPETTSPTKDQSSDVCNSYTHDISWQKSSDSGDQVPDVAIDNSLCCTELSYGADSCMFTDDVKEDLPSGLDPGSLCSPVSKCSSSWEPYQCLNHNDDSVSVEDGSPPTEEKQPSISANADVARNCSSPGTSSVSLEDDSLTTKEKQPLVSITADAEINCSIGCHPSGIVDELSPSAIKNFYHSKLWHPPGRLLSTRKAISPTSQERLCQAMDSIELKENVEYYKCKGKLCFGKQTENKVSSAGSDFEGAEVTMNPEGPGQVNRIKVTISPKQIIKQPNNDKKGSPPKGIFKGPRLSRSIPHVSTDCTSIQNCSKSAIAFSQRQMHDIECLSMKLMNELKSMKDIVEEKLHSEGYPTTSLKHHELKSAIKNATKVEETSRRWLSMMARDCSRFCKIMRLTEKGAAAPENAIHKERRKITFADEAGGMLCHVKFFEDGMASLESESEKQELPVK